MVFQMPPGMYSLIVMSKWIEQECWQCGGLGTDEDRDGNPRRCPHCHGSGVVNVHVNEVRENYVQDQDRSEIKEDQENT